MLEKESVKKKKKKKTIVFVPVVVHNKPRCFISIYISLVVEPLEAGVWAENASIN